VEHDAGAAEHDEADEALSTVEAVGPTRDCSDLAVEALGPAIVEASGDYGYPVDSENPNL
jgi:hypothetical protein